MRTDQPVTIQRSDYAPPAYTVDTVDLEFNLDCETTRVEASMSVRRLAPPGVPLRFDGDGPKLLEIEVDTHLLSAAEWEIAPDGALVLTPETLARHCDDQSGIQFQLKTVVEIAPAQNTALSGLYVSGQSLYTQCEAEGFRRITFFPDRPDVMARYRVTLRGDRTQFPVLLSNGNLIDQGVEPGDKHHWARWEDPFPKPSYLFALVAGGLVVHEERWQRRSGRDALLQVWVEPGNLDKTAHAMASLKQAIRWDETRFGLELDLDRYMIVAVGDFNMGAMENKGLNLFNTRYVFANPRIATDDDYFNITSVVGHEYFHNWTGNRITCRDWFQLTLKEGLTVFRDQEFSADLLAESASSDAMAASARAVQRIDNVRFLRSQQFAEDAGPMAHPIRPESYQEINNFYTVTVYEKGAEVIRMLQTLVGQAGFRSGMDLYFARHDGQAVACDDFVAAIADANGRQLDQFRRWYETAGTPHVFARGRWDSDTRRYTLHLAQWLPAVAGRLAGAPDRPLHIPIAVGLLGADGTDLIGTQLIELTQAEQEITFEGIHAEPVPSLGRGFSAPIILDFPYRTQDLVHLIAFDSDPFNRWEAAQRLAVTAIISLLDGGQGFSRVSEANPLDALVNVLRGILSDANLAADFKAQMLSLPSEGYVAEQIGMVNPVTLRDARDAVERHLAQHASAEWDRAWQATAPVGAYQPDPVSASRRVLRNLALRMRILAGECLAMAQASDQLLHADNMTDRLGALHALGGAPAAAREPAIESFEQLLSDEPLAMDKWFAHQAMLHHQTGDIAVLERVRTLIQHPAYSARNPNRVRALIGSFCHGNLAEFHRADGAGYQFWIEQVLALDSINPQIAARLARALDRWRKFTPDLQQPMQVALQSVLNRAESPDVLEIVRKALAEAAQETPA